MVDRTHQADEDGSRRTLVITGLDPAVRLPGLVEIFQRVGGVEQVVLEHDHAPDGRELAVARIVFDRDRLVQRQPH